MQQKDTSSLPASSALPPWRAALASAISRVDFDIWIALALIFVGWFVLETLQVVWGPMKHSVHFYDLGTIIKNPTLLFTGVEGERGTNTVIFTLLCFAALIALLTPYFWRARFSWFALFAPLVLIAVCALLLYARAPGDILPEQSGGDTIANDLRHFANHLFHRAAAGMARKVTLGAGGYLALIGSVYLAARAVRSFLKHRTGGRSPA